ncbi:MAG: hypothetical protein U1C97_01290, partial [Candidatus Gracilibacteria bacterium]|nr:hypothetical protein [Candidatus Gracilibacteria bacterium]
MLFFRSCFSLSFFAALFGVFSLPSVFAFSAESYQIGPLLDGEAAPFTIDQTFRVSLWDTYDVRAGDIREDGTINPSARHYGGYQTSVSLSPDESGIYTLVLASLVGFPDPIGSLQMFMQVEYKEFGSPDTSYLSYDFVNDPPWQNITRQLLLDEASYFTGDAGPLTNYNTFILDGNGNAPDAVILQFGEVLGETLRWSIANSRFELSDNLKIGNGTASDVMLIFDDGSSR